tara:strand:+ start:67 stop:267 length:201 start_codon:yes stop_codon:yes gene_type:complete
MVVNSYDNFKQAIKRIKKLTEKFNQERLDKLRQNGEDNLEQSFIIGEILNIAGPIENFLNKAESKL